MQPHPEVFWFLVFCMHKYKVYLELVFYMKEKHWLFKSVKHTKIIPFLRLNQEGNYWEDFFPITCIFKRPFFIDKGQYIMNSIS